MIERLVKNTILTKLFKGKAIIITGPRQTGKTTLVKKILAGVNIETLFLNADEPDISGQLEGASSTLLKRMIGKRRLVVIDEAQRVKNIGLTLKLITDEIPEVQLIVTGSSSLELVNETKEPLTGRKLEYHLYPLSFQELEDHFGFLEERRLLPSRLVFGSYPDIVTHQGEEKELLSNLADSYLYRDLLNLSDMRRPELLSDLLEALALQLSHEVKFSELGEMVGADQGTVKKYIDLLEKSFVVFRLRAFSRNVRNEIKKSRKIYFYDNGIRNAIIRNYAPVELRSDIGALWENYLVSERLKYNAYHQQYLRMWFWRTTQQQEIDLIEEKDHQLEAWEFKWNPKRRVKWSKTFTRNYPGALTGVVHPENYGDFLVSK